MPSAIASRPAASVRGLTKRFGGRVALDGVDLELAHGELRGLLGPNGAGKTTLLRALFGLVRPDAGTVELLGRTSHPSRFTQLHGVGGFVEEPSFYPYLSARGNLELLAELDAVGADRVDGCLDRVGLATRAEERVAGFSTGMRQRLGIAAALLRQPELLLLDEPTSGLDPAGVRDVARILRDLAAEGVAVLVSSHLIGELEALCTAHTILRDGRVVWDGGRARLAADAPASAYALRTSDDARALEIARGQGSVQLLSDPGRAGLRLLAASAGVDEFAIALGAAGVAIRRLEQITSPLEGLFFALTA